MNSLSSQCLVLVLIMIKLITIIFLLNSPLLLWSKSIGSNFNVNDIEPYKDKKHGIVMGMKIKGCDDGEVSNNFFITSDLLNVTFLDFCF